MRDILAVIVQLREARGWSEYQLAEESGVPQSTISSWYRKGAVPKISSLEKICDTFGITMSQLFADGETVFLTSEQQQLLKHWSRLTEEKRSALLHLMAVM